MTEPNKITAEFDGKGNLASFVFESTESGIAFKHSFKLMVNGHYDASFITYDERGKTIFVDSPYPELKADKNSAASIFKTALGIISTNPDLKFDIKDKFEPLKEGKTADFSDMNRRIINAQLIKQLPSDVLNEISQIGEDYRKEVAKMAKDALITEKEYSKLKELATQGGSKAIERL